MNELSLGEHERLLAQSGLSAWSALPRLFSGALLCLAAGAMLTTPGAEGPGLVALGFGLATCAWAELDRRSARIWLTDRRVVIRTGWLSRETMDLPLERVESSRVAQTPLQRWLGYGEVGAVGVGGTRAPLLGIDDPWEFKAKIERARRDLERQARSITAF